MSLLRKKMTERKEQVKGERALQRQIRNLAEETDAVNASPDLTPETYCGHRRKYHYKDVNIWVIWQYSGQYGKSCKSISIRRGDELELVPQPDKDDPEVIAVLWKGTHIGYMKSNRLRNMVLQWRKEGLPVMTKASQVGGEHKIMIEFAFYGCPKNK